MNKFSNLRAAKQTANVTLGQAALSLKNAVMKAGLKDPALTDAAISTEAMSPMLHASFTEATNTSKQLLETALQSAGIKTDAATLVKGISTEAFTEGLTSAQIQAGVAVMTAYGNPSAYARASLQQARYTGDASTTIVGVGAESLGMDYRALETAGYSFEAFDDTAIEPHLPQSIIFNVMAARQDAFGELFYKTVVVSPDQAGLEISVTQTVIVDDAKHNADGRVFELNRRNLILATVDASMLANTATKVVPVVLTGVNVGKFADAAIIAAAPTTVDGHVFDTAPYRPSVDIDLLGLAQNPALAEEGILNQTDSLDHRNNLSKAYFQITAASNNSKSVVSYETTTLPRSQFQKSREGSSRDMTLQFETADLPLTSLTKDITGAAPTALALLATPAYADLIIRLKTTVFGTLNVETANAKVQATTAEIDTVWRKGVNGGDVTQVTDPTVIAALRAEFTKIELVGYELQAFRSNINRRQRGLIVNTITRRELYTIDLQAPITGMTPLTDTGSSIDVQGPINAARIRNSNAAVTKMLNTRNAMDVMMASQKSGYAVPEIEGIGRYALVKPYFESRTINVAEITNSLRSADRQADLQAAIVNAIRDMSYTAHRDTGYQAALEAETGATGKMPFLAIGTDPSTARHLMVNGDARLAGVMFDHAIVTTVDSRVRNRIFLSFVRPDLEEANPLSFGTMAWMPELATTLPISRGGATVKELTVQTRTRHIVTCPILMEIVIEGMSEAISGSAPIQVSV